LTEWMGGNTCLLAANLLDRPRLECMACQVRPHVHGIRLYLPSLPQGVRGPLPPLTLRQLTLCLTSRLPPG
jgi:hypothetical protein